MPSTLERPTVFTTGFANAGPGQTPWQPVFSAPPETGFLVREVRAHFFPDNLITPSGYVMTFRTKGTNLNPGTAGGDDVLHYVLVLQVPGADNQGKGHAFLPTQPVEMLVPPGTSLDVQILQLGSGGSTFSGSYTILGDLAQVK